jgi:EAL domain-containing protein (putative c-di-GMP-specific phosphodiesterase class I)/FixJ family two-component response regulator
MSSPAIQKNAGPRNSFVPAPGNPMENYRLLVMDDDPMVAEVAANIVQALGGQGRTTTRVSGLLEAINSWAPTHIAVDLAMPDVDGVEVMNMLARRRCSARIIISSGMGEEVLAAAMRAAAANGLDVAGVLPKPFKLQQLKALLASSSPPPTAASSPEAQMPAAAKTAALTPVDLRRALEGGAIFPMFMPKVECSSGKLTGFESHARWRHPQLGILNASRFIDLAERSGLIAPLTETINAQALSWLGATHPQDSIGLTLRLSAASIGDLALVDTLARQCEQASLDPRRVTVRISEAAAMAEAASALQLLTRLRIKGFRLSLGNVGVGHVSLAQLVRLPFSELILDHSLCSPAGDTADGRAVAKALVGVGKSLGLTVTASGIESAARLLYFCELGCDRATGFFIAKPMEAAALNEWVNRLRSAVSNRWEKLLSGGV